MKQTKFQNKGNNGKPTNRHDEDDPEYEDKYAVEVEEVETPDVKGAQDLDHSYEHYLIPHHINDKGVVTCPCKEIRRLVPR